MHEEMTMQLKIYIIVREILILLSNTSFIVLPSNLFFKKLVQD